MAPASLLFVGLTIFVAIGMYTGSVSSIWNALAVIGGAGLDILICVPLILTISRFSIPVHPVKALGSSFGFVVGTAMVIWTLVKIVL